jgi:fimbrial isopeptide formation D2 family protein
MLACRSASSQYKNTGKRGAIEKKTLEFVLDRRYKFAISSSDNCKNYEMEASSICNMKRDFLELQTAKRAGENSHGATSQLPLKTLKVEKTRQIVFIDPTVDDRKSLIDGVIPGTEVVILDATRDGIEQITEILGHHHTPLEAIHIVAHGQPGSIRLGKSQLSHFTLSRYASTLQRWRRSIEKDAEILLYSCQVAAGALGASFVRQLREITGVDIAASTTLVGNAALDGNWELDVRTGTRPTPLAFAPEALATYPATLQDGVGNRLFASETGATPNIRVVSIADATSEVVGQLLFETAAIARDAESGLVYYVEKLDGVGNGVNARVATFNPATGDNNIIGTLGNAVATQTLAFAKMAQASTGTTDPQFRGQLFALAATSELFLIDRATGQARSLGNITGGFAGGGGDVAFDPSNPDIIYVTEAARPNNGGTDTIRLYRVDINTLQATRVGNTGLPRTDSGSLAFGPDGELYTTSQVGGQTNLYRLSLTNAAPTEVGSLDAAFGDFGTQPIASPEVELTATKTDNLTNVQVGGTVTYSITITNTGTLPPNPPPNLEITDLSGITVSDSIPNGIQINANSIKATFSGGTGELVSSNVTGQDFSAQLNLEAGATVTLTISGTVTEAAVSPIENTVRVEPPEGFVLVGRPPGNFIEATDTTELNNLPPTADNVTDNVAPSQTRILTGLIGRDRDGTIANYTIATLPPANQGTLFLNGNPVTAGQDLTPDELRQLEFRAGPNFTGTTFTYTATDNNGDPSPPATVNLNPPPIAQDDSVPATPGASTALPPLEATDPNGTVSFYTITTLPPADQGVLLLNGNPVPAGTKLTPQEIDDLVFQATPNFNGSTFQFTATDNNGFPSAPATISLTPRQSVPETNDVVDRIPPGETQTLTGLGGTDPDGIESFTITELPPADQGVLLLDGNPVKANQVLTPEELTRLQFQAGPNFTGTTFRYSTTDTTGATDATPGIVKLNTGVAEPDTDDANVGVPQQAPVRVTGLGGEPGAPGSDLSFFTITSVPPVSQGTLFLGDPDAGGTPITVGQTLTPDQLDQVFFRPTATFNGTTFQYAATNSFGETDPTPGTVTLTNGNAPPNTDNATAQLTPGLTAPIRDLGGTDSDGLVSFFTIKTLPPAGQGILFLGDPAQGGTPVTVGQRLTEEELDRLFFQAGSGFTGASFTYTATDNLGLEDPTPATVSLTAPGVPGDGEGTEPPPVPGGGGVVITQDPEDPCPPPPTIGGFDVAPPADVDLNTLAFPTPGTRRPGGSGNDRITGGDGNEDLVGEDGDDQIRGGRGDDIVLGGFFRNAPLGPGADRDLLGGNEGRDLIAGSAGNDSIYGGQEDDTAFGGKDNDDIYGDRGSDMLLGDLGNDRIAGDSRELGDSELSGTDRIDGGQGNDTLNGNEKDDTVTGGVGDDVVQGGKDGDRIFGDEGNDTVGGDLGDDTVLGSLGSPVQIGANGERDMIFGNRGRDVLKGGEGRDSAYGGKENDLIYGGKDEDLIFGDQGSDTLVGDLGNDTVVGGNGNPGDPEGVENDLLFGLDGNDLLLGNRGNDSIVSGSGDDTACGGLEDDFIWGEAGNDRLFGELGNDTICGGEGNDTIVGSNGVPGSPNDGRDMLVGGAGDDSIFGNDEDDRLEGSSGNDSLYGGRGNDTFVAGSGNDLAFGDLGNDSIEGGEGNDTLVGSNGVPGSPDDGNDTLVGGNGDDLMFGNEQDDILGAGGGNDVVFGGQGNDAIAGEAGNDLIYGDVGDDLISGGAGADVFVLAIGTGTDTIVDFEVGVDLLGLAGELTFEQLTFTQEEGITIVGVGDVPIVRLSGILVEQLADTNFLAV